MYFGCTALSIFIEVKYCLKYFYFILTQQQNKNKYFPGTSQDLVYFSITWKKKIKRYNLGVTHQGTSFGEYVQFPSAMGLQLVRRKPSGVYLYCYQFSHSVDGVTEISVDSQNSIILRQCDKNQVSPITPPTVKMVISLLPLLPDPQICSPALSLIPAAPQ